MEKYLLHLVLLASMSLVLGCIQKEIPEPENIYVDVRLEYQAIAQELKATAVLHIGDGLDKRPIFAEDKIALNGVKMLKIYKPNKGLFYQLESEELEENFLFTFEDYQKKNYRINIPFGTLQVQQKKQNRYPKGKSIFLAANIPNLQATEQVFAAFIVQSKLMPPIEVEYKKGTLILPTEHLPKGKIKAFFYRLNRLNIEEEKTTIKVQSKAISDLIEFEIF